MFDLPGTQIINPGGGAASDGPETGWSDVWRSTIRSMREVDNSNARWQAMENAVDDINDAARTAGITDPLFVNPFRQRFDSRAAGVTRNDPSYGAYSPLLDDRIGWWEKKRRELADKHPEQRALLRVDTPLEELARERARAAEEEAQQAAQRYQGWAPAWTASLPGGLAASFYDPINLATLAAGPWGGVRLGASNVLWQAIKAAGINAGSEALTQPLVQAWRADAGLDYGWGLAAQNTVLAGLMGFALEGGIRAANRLLIRPALGQVPRLDTAGHVVGWMRPLEDAAAPFRDNHGRTFAPEADTRFGWGTIYREQAPAPRPSGEPGAGAAAESTIPTGEGARLPGEGEARPTAGAGATPGEGHIPGGEGTPRARLPEAEGEDAEAIAAARRELEGSHTGLPDEHVSALARYIAETGQEAPDALAYFDGLSAARRKKFLKEYGERRPAGPQPAAQQPTAQPVAQSGPQPAPPPVVAPAIPHPPGPPLTADAAMELAARNSPDEVLRRAQAGDPVAQAEIARRVGIGDRPSVQGALNTAIMQGALPEGLPEGAGGQFMSEARKKRAELEYLKNAVDPDNTPATVPPAPVGPQLGPADAERAAYASTLTDDLPDNDYRIWGKDVRIRRLDTADIGVDQAAFPRPPQDNILQGVRRWNPFFADYGFYVFERRAPEGAAEQAKAAGQPGFRTADGRFRIDEDGHTTGPDGVRSEQPTLYVTPDDAARLRQAAGTDRLAAVRGYRIGMREPEKWELIPDTAVAFRQQPVVGMIPLHRAEGGRRLDFGKPIADVIAPSTPKEMRGQMVVAEGHDRLELAHSLQGEAQRAGLRNVPAIDIKAAVFREVDGWTESDVRVLAAKKRLNTGREKDPVDLAVIMRERRDMLADPTLETTGTYAERAEHLARLSPEAWARVYGGDIDPLYAALVGKHVMRPEEHAEALDLVDRALKGTLRPDTDDPQVTVSNVAQAVSILNDFVYRTRRDHVDTVLVTDPGAMLYGERALVLDQAVKELQKNKAVFKQLVDEVARIVGVGRNVLDTAANLGEEAESALARQVIGLLAARPGPVRDMLSDVAKDLLGALPSGRNKQRAAALPLAKRFVDQVRKELREKGADALAPYPPERLEGGGPGIDDPGGPRAQQQVERLRADLVAQTQRMERETASYHFGRWVEKFGPAEVERLTGARAIPPDVRLEAERLMAAREVMDVPGAIAQARANLAARAEAEATVAAERAAKRAEEAKTGAVETPAAARAGEEEGAATEPLTPQKIEQLLISWNFVGAARKLQPPGSEGRLPPAVASVEADLVRYGIAQAETPEEVRSILEARAAQEQLKPAAAETGAAAHRTAGEHPAEPGRPGTAGGAGEGAGAGVSARGGENAPGGGENGPLRPPRTPEDDFMAAVGAGADQARDLDALGFYSKALEAAKVLPQAKGTPEQMLSMLKKAGAKDAEIEATGLRSILEGKKSVTRDDIVKHLTENRMEVREAVYGRKAIAGDNRDYLARSAYGRRWDDLSQAEQNQIIQDEGESTAKWSRYSLDPANPTYRETVLHLPVPEWIEPRIAEIHKELAAIEAAPRLRPSNKLSNEPRWLELKSELDRLHVLRKGDFQQGHFSDEPNVIAHARTSLQKDAQGNTVFLVDELQSDWGQKIREGGARDETKIAELRKQLEPAERELQETAAERRAIAGKTHGRGSPEMDAVLDREIKLRSRAELLRAELRTAEAATPGHPLVSTTDQWTTTAFRRLVAQAVAAGADRIAITPGKVQADRFNLAKQVQALRYNAAERHLSVVEVGRRIDRNNPVSSVTSDWHQIASDVAPEQLPDYVGKEMSEKLLAAPKHGNSHVLLDIGSLEVGGSGMKATYDGIYLKNLGKILKGLDPTIKEPVDEGLLSSLDGRTFVETKRTSGWESTETPRQVEKPGAPPIQFHVFPITDTIKARVTEEGQALFATAADPIRRAQADAQRARNLFDAGLKLGAKRASVDTDVVQSGHAVLAPHIDLLRPLPGYRAGFLESARTLGPGRVRMVFAMHDGTKLARTVDWQLWSRQRAVHLPDERAILFLRFAAPEGEVRLGVVNNVDRITGNAELGADRGNILLGHAVPGDNRLPGRSPVADFRDSLVGEFVHELYHAYRRAGLIDDSTHAFLVSHGKSLRLLEGELNTYLRSIRRGDEATARPGVTLKDRYEALYRNRLDKATAVDEEYATHLAELAWHRDGLLPMDLGPVREALERIFSGDSGMMARRLASHEGKPTFAIAGPRMQLPELARLEMAQWMEREGATDIEVYNSTGWFRDSEGGWMFQIPDEDIRLRQRAADTAMGRGRGRYTQPGPLQDIVSAPLHFEAYPRVAEARVALQHGTSDVMRKGLMGVSGFRLEGAPASDEIVAAAASAKRAREMFVKAIQTAIDRIEDRGPGAEPAAFGVIRRAKADLDMQAAAVMEKLAALDDPRYWFGQMAEAPIERVRLTEQLSMLRSLRVDLDEMSWVAAWHRARALERGEPQAAVGGAGEFRPIRGLFAAPAETLSWLGLSQRPLRANLTNIANKRALKDAVGQYGPGNDLHTPGAVQAHITQVLSAPDYAWLKANRDGTFSWNIVRLGEDGVDRVIAVPVSAVQQAERGGREVLAVSTAFNQYREQSITRLLAALHQEGARGLRIAKSPEGERGLLRLMEQVPEHRRGSSWLQIRDVLTESQRQREISAALQRARRASDLEAAVGGGDEDVLGGGSAFDQASDETWADVARRGHLIQQAVEAKERKQARGPSARQMEDIGRRSVLGRRADQLERLGRDLKAIKTQLKAEGREADEIADALNEQFGTRLPEPITASDIAREMWWDAAEHIGRRQPPWKPQHLAELARLHAEGMPIRDIARRISDVRGSATSEAAVRQQLRLKGLIVQRRRAPVLAWLTDERMSAIEDMVSQGLKDHQIAAELAREPDLKRFNITASTISTARGWLGLASAAGRTRALTPQMAAMVRETWSSEAPRAGNGGGRVLLARRIAGEIERRFGAAVNWDAIYKMGVKSETAAGSAAGAPAAGGASSRGRSGPPPGSPWADPEVMGVLTSADVSALSAGAAAELLNARFGERGYSFTRNAIIGKRHRIDFYPVRRKGDFEAAIGGGDEEDVALSAFEQAQDEGWAAQAARLRPGDELDWNEANAIRGLKRPPPKGYVETEAGRLTQAVQSFEAKLRKDPQMTDEAIAEAITEHFGFPVDADPARWWWRKEALRGTMPEQAASESAQSFAQGAQPSRKSIGFLSATQKEDAKRLAVQGIPVGTITDRLAESGGKYVSPSAVSQALEADAVKRAIDKRVVWTEEMRAALNSPELRGLSDEEKARALDPTGVLTANAIRIKRKRLRQAGGEEAAPLQRRVIPDEAKAWLAGDQANGLSEGQVARVLTHHFGYEATPNLAGTLRKEARRRMAEAGATGEEHHVTATVPAEAIPPPGRRSMPREAKAWLESDEAQAMPQRELARALKEKFGFATDAETAGDARRQARRRTLNRAEAIQAQVDNADPSIQSLSAAKTAEDTAEILKACKS